MNTILDPAGMADWSAQQRINGRKVHFVPTMGALHAGHLALVHAARTEGAAVVASVFVNPLQFNDPQDLAKYPRQPAADAALLEQAGCHALFMPTADKLYANATMREYDLAGLDLLWEGRSRPGHFQGVAKVLERLFHFVRPDKAFFGEKDRQQVAVVRQVATAERWPVGIVTVPTVRSAEGLALSSRNARMSEAEAESALALHRALALAADRAFREPVRAVEADARATLEAVGGVVTDYFTIAHPDTLQPLQDWDGLNEAVALVAAQVGPVRLIDNMTLRR